MVPRDEFLANFREIISNGRKRGTIFTVLDVKALVLEAGMDPPGLGAIEDEIGRVVASKTDLLNQLSTKLLKAGGKRIRPALVMLSAAFKPCNAEDVVSVATAVELIHMASLIHDDIIDSSSVRRGKETINCIAGNHVAVLTGDYLFATAFNILSAGKQYEVLRLMTGVIKKMCEGEIKQASQNFNHSQTEEDYFERIYKKTACLLSASCRAGAVISGLEQNYIGLLEEFGRNIGCAYQIIDDILDYIADTEKLGKPVCADLSQGIITLPVLYLLQHEKFGPWLKKIFEKGVFTYQELNTVRQVVLENGGIDYAYDLAGKYINTARSVLKQMPAAPPRDMLMRLADFLYARLK